MRICLLFHADDAGGHAAHDGIVRDVLRHHGVSPHGDVVADRDRAEDLCLEPEIAIVAHAGGARAGAFALLPNTMPGNSVQWRPILAPGPTCT